jgi:hypothetical protein
MDITVDAPAFCGHLFWTRGYCSPPDAAGMSPLNIEEGLIVDWWLAIFEPWGASTSPFDQTLVASPEER